ncbi:MAG: hypothetical protein ACXABY_02880 [Candidatus Thorarchaeota archaeon]|jgi:hypothetical protein
MPIFDWKCQVCGYVWEEIVNMDKAPIRCPKDVPKGQAEDELEAKHTALGEHAYSIKKLPALFGKFKTNWSKWRALS